jgi:hypothetical protein
LPGEEDVSSSAESEKEVGGEGIKVKVWSNYLGQRVKGLEK